MIGVRLESSCNLGSRASRRGPVHAFPRRSLLSQLVQALDGLAPSEEELAEAQLPLLEEDAEATEPTEPAEPTEPTEQSDPRAKAAKVGGGADWCRLSLAFGQLQNHKAWEGRRGLSRTSGEPAVSGAVEGGAAVAERRGASFACATPFQRHGLALFT